MEEDIQKELILSKLDWAIREVREEIYSHDVIKLKSLIYTLKDIQRDVREY